MNDSRIHAPRYGGRIIKDILGGTVRVGGGWDPERPRRLDFYEGPCVWWSPGDETDPVVILFGDIACETVYYGAWETGTRTIYQTKIPLWEETVKSGNPMVGYESPPRFTAYPPALPDKLPEGALSMDDSDPYFGCLIDFGDNALAAFCYCEGVTL